VSDIVRDARPYLTEAFDYDAEAARKHLGGTEVASRLSDLAGALGGVDPFDEAGAEAALRALGEKLGIPAARLIHPARVALTGAAVGPGIFEVMILMGREGTVARLRNAAAAIGRPRGSGA
jgi:nondiscriminating glutamyl-tRNA synthetase